MTKHTPSLLVFTALIAFCAASPAFALPLEGAPQNGALQAGKKQMVTAIATNQDALAQGAKDFVTDMGKRGIDFLANPNITLDKKKAEFSALLDDSFDMATIGRFSLGPYWQQATPAQQKEYQKLFRAMVIKVYSQRFADYQGQSFDVQSVRAQNEKDFIVTSFIVPNDGARVQVDWRVRTKGGQYKIVDIVVEGVSMSQTQRADFASVIQRGGGNVDVLLNHLRKQ